MSQATRKHLVDGTAIEIAPDGAYDLTLPSGRHIRGRAADVDAAQKVVAAEHSAFIIEQWSKGALHRNGSFVCPLT